MSINKSIALLLTVVAVSSCTAQSKATDQAPSNLLAEASKGNSDDDSHSSWQTEKDKASVAAENSQDSHKAIEHLRKAIKAAKENGAPVKTQIDLYKQMIAHSGKLQSLDIYNEALLGQLELAKESGNKQLEEDTLINLANIEYSLKQYHQAIEHVKQVIPKVTRSRGENFPGLIRANQLLGTLYVLNHQPTLAKEALNRALLQSTHTSSQLYTGSIGLSNAYLGLIAHKEKDYQEAEKRYLKAKALIDRLKDRDPRRLSMVDKELLAFPIGEVLGKLESEKKQKQ